MIWASGYMRRGSRTRTINRFVTYLPTYLPIYLYIYPFYHANPIQSSAVFRSTLPPPPSSLSNALLPLSPLLY